MHSRASWSDASINCLTTANQGSILRYTIKDAALGPFGIFHTQSPSFLDDQHHLQQAKGRNNACTLFGVEQIPCHNQGRNLLKESSHAPVTFNGVYLEVFEGLAPTWLVAQVSGAFGPTLGGTRWHPVGAAIGRVVMLAKPATFSKVNVSSPSRSSVASPTEWA